jgi:hypothetical protein
MAKATRALAKMGVDKSSENAAQGFNFRGIDAVLGAMSKVLVEAQLVVLPSVLAHNVSSLVVNGKTKFLANVQVRYNIMSVVDGSYLSTVVCAEAIDAQDKSTSKALSMAYKYFAFQTFCIPLEGVLDDADSDSPMQDRGEPAAEAAPEKPARKSRKTEAAKEEAAPSLPAPAVEDADATALVAKLNELAAGDAAGLQALRGQLLGYRGQAVFAALKAAYKDAQARVEAKA